MGPGKGEMVHSDLVRISVKCLAVSLRVLGFFQSFSAEWVKTMGHLGEAKKKKIHKYS